MCLRKCVGGELAASADDKKVRLLRKSRAFRVSATGLALVVLVVRIVLVIVAAVLVLIVAGALVGFTAFALLAMLALLLAGLLAGLGLILTARRVLVARLVVVVVLICHAESSSLLMIQPVFVIH
jgi:hypothetical protein